MTEDPLDQTFTVGQVADLCGRSQSWIKQLTQAGHIKTRGRGRYPLRNLTRGIVAHYEALIEKGSKAAVASKASEARTKEIELRTAMRARSVIPIEDAEVVVAGFAAAVLEELSALPARVTRDLELRKAIEAETGRVLDRLKDRAEGAGQAFLSGSEDLDEG